jgi:AcrR family transcriptional regulator
MPARTDMPVSSIRDGAFFTLPEALPRGRHNLSREQVRSAQRERVLAATTELLGAHGYRGFGPSEIAHRARISLAAFYDLFENKDECIFAGYDRFSEVLLARLARVPMRPGDRPATIGDLLRAYFETLEQDHVVARAYLVEIEGLGAAARKKRRESINLFAEYIRQIDVENPRTEGGPRELPWTAYIGVVYAIRQLASDALDTEAHPDLTAIGENMELWLTDLFRERGY